MSDAADARDRRDALAAALTRPSLMDAADVRRLVDAPLPTGRRLTRARQKLAIQTRFSRYVSKAMSTVERLSPRRIVECPVCGWQGVAFRPLAGSGRILWNAQCPGCLSLGRHRLFVLGWLRHPEVGKVRLHMAPESWLARFVADGATSVIQMDIEQPGVTLHADAQQLPLRASAVDVVIANDVLEHVPDDSRALAEMRRVLHPGGLALLHVPIVAAETVEFGFANPLDHGHRRAYGPDVIDRILASEFEVSLFATQDCAPEERRRHGLPDGDGLVLARPRSSN